MKISAISSQTFQAKKFRIPVEVTMPNKDNPMETVTRRMIQEYSNPNAKNYYEQAQREKSFQRQIELYEAMGEYKLIEPKEESFWTKLKRKFVDLWFED